jgi:urease accessory protein
MRTVLLQLADSGFPAGAFAHSGGLEALSQLGLLRDEAQLQGRLEELVWHTAHGALPFLNDAHLGDAVRADRACDVYLSNHVAQRASRAQGRAFLLAAVATFESPAVSALKDSLPHSHLPVAFGAALATRRITLEETRHTFLFSAARSALSAAVRLGVLGPLRAQALLYGLDGVLEEALVTTADLEGADATSVSVWLETAQAGHDGLYSRLFQS